MSKHYEELSDGFFRIWYDDPENEDPTFGQKMWEFKVSYDNPKVEDIITLAIEDARDKLEPGTIFEIRGKYVPPEGEDGVLNYGRRPKPREYFIDNWGVAWYYVKDLPQEVRERVPLAKAVMNDTLNYALIARLAA